MIFITGDTHGDFTRFSTKVFYEQKEMTKDDYVIICGDFGGIWRQKEDRHEKYWLDWLESKPFTTLFIDGNHENYNRLDAYPVEEWHGGKVHKIRPSIIHLMRGQIFDINGKKFFTFGGASSHDIKDGILDPNDKNFLNTYKEWKREYKYFRVKGISWWSRELPSQEEMDEGILNLEKNGNKVDYVITHSPYTSMLRLLDGGSHFYKSDYLSDYLQNIKQNIDYNIWFFGHMHINKNIYFEKSIGIYEQIIRIE